MSRCSALCALFGCLVISYLSIAVSSAFGQITDDTSSQTTPTPGDGHDYVKMLGETVNPADGSVSLQISLPTPSGRGLSLPFAYTYNSSAPFLQPGNMPGWQEWGYDRFSNSLTSGAWSTTLPWLSAVRIEFASTTLGQPNCYAATGYTFHDSSGGTHPLGLAAVLSPSGTLSCSQVSWTSQTTGGDDFVQATLLGAVGSLVGSPPNPAVGEVLVADGDGTVYKFGPDSWGAPPAGGDPQDTTAQGVPATIEDRNGNVVTFVGEPSIVGNPPTSIVDSTGRTELSFSGGLFGSTTVSGIPKPYKFTAGTGSYSGVSLGGILLYGASTECGVFPTFNAQGGFSAITLPNGQAYTFTYDPAYGLLSKITYPTGGYVSYVWGLNAQSAETSYPNSVGYLNGCLYRYSHPAIVTRSVSFDGKTIALKQNFTYTTTWDSGSAGYDWTNKTTTVTTTDNIAGTTSTVVYAYGCATYLSYGCPVAPIIPNTNSPQVYNTVPQQIPVENTITYKNSSGTVLKTVTKGWTGNSLYPEGDPSELGYELTTLPNGLASSVCFGWGPGHTITGKEEWDFGIVSASSPCPSNTTNPTRETQTAYQSFAATPIYPYAPSILDRPASVSTYGNGTLAAQTLYGYDQFSVQGVSNLPAGTHDETNYGTAKSPARGNATTVTRECLTCTNAVTTYKFDETGNILSVTDPCGNGTCSDITGTTHTTSYSYSDSYTILSSGTNVSYTPSGNTNTYLTTLTDPLGHTENFTYDYNNGQLTVLTDENSQSTKYLYNDPFARPTLVNYPDGGQTQNAYNDSPYNPSTPSPSVTITRAITSSVNEVSTAAFDGMGHTIETILSSDPGGATYTAATYDGIGQVYRAYNPTRCNPPTTNCGTETTWGYTTTNYDALNRVTSVIEQDGSVVTTTYDQTNASSPGDCTTVTDEAGNSRQSCADGLGRLTSVWEAPTTTGYNFETVYAYDPMNDLLSVSQEGGSTSSNWRIRSFAYDSLSRLTSATNPESGKIAYSYDANSNLSTKTAPSPNQIPTGTATVITTYSYDVLNRLTGKNYNDSDTNNPATPSVSYGYDGVLLSCPDPVGFAGKSATNGIGRRTAMCFSAGSKSWQYDPMGRISDQNDRFIGLVPPLYKYNIFTNSAGVQSTTTDTEYNYYLNGDLSIVYYPGQGIPNEEFYTTESGAGRITTAGDASNHALTSGTYTPDGQLATAEVCANTCNASNTYNSRLQPVLISTSTTSGTKILNLTYNFNPGHDNGNVIQIANGKDSNRTQNFLYDPLNRVWQAYTNGPNWGNTYSENTYAAGTTFSAANAGIDAWGNLAHRSGVTGKGLAETTMDCPANTNNQLTTCGYGYDPAGNMTSKGSISYVYDAENRLIATGGDSYLYDGDGQRIEKCTEGATPGTCSSTATGTFYWLQVGGGTLAESDLGANWTAAYGLISGQIMDRVDLPANVVHYYFHDQLNSTNIVTDSAGNIKNESDYSPYGVEIPIISGDSNRYKFTGKERDPESGLDNFGARYYASTMGRFMIPDPDQESGIDNMGNPQMWNGYAYVGNNPLNATDPDGRSVYICVGGSALEGGTCTTVSDEAYNQAQQQDQYNHAASLDQLKDSGQQSNITDANGNVVGTVQYSPDDPKGAPVEGINPEGEKILAGYAAGGIFGRAFGAAWGTVAGWFGRGAEAAGTTAGEAAGQLGVRAGGIIERVFQTPSGPVQVYCKIVAEGDTAVVKELAIYPAESNTAINVGTVEMKQGLSAIKGELREAGFTEVRIEPQYRVGGANAGGYTPQMTFKLK
jgi:RHS repeat-associated protein